ncbi:hypothetical protein [Chryseobacterium gwangjuense]|uniref:hypothetical protein n=1 Tax=Chryseobacterium gwangjuense TaxID=1069980 RepID=UPI001E39DE6B|nr:hypothetical protein [Chryseobacterium gwangjuense]MCE3076735.1 hypothetical protein [Chryseobacterium gwangjuense]
MKESDKYEQSIRVERIATKEDELRNPILIEGTKFSEIPIPKDKQNLIERFEKLYAQRWFEVMQKHFLEKKCKGLSNEIFYEQEIEELETFISKTRTLNIFDAIDKNIQSSYYEFLRLENNYYNSNLKYQNDFEVFDYFNHDSDYVYAKYFLYKKWLESSLSELQGINTPAHYINENTELQQMINVVFSGDGDMVNLLKYFSDNFTSTYKKFTNLTKYNQIYYYFNVDDIKIEQAAYKRLIMLLFEFDYKKSEIKGVSPKHQMTLDNLKISYNNSKG